MNKEIYCLKWVIITIVSVVGSYLAITFAGYGIYLLDNKLTGSYSMQIIPFFEMLAGLLASVIGFIIIIFVVVTFEEKGDYYK